MAKSSREVTQALEHHKSLIEQTVAKHRQRPAPAEPAGFIVRDIDAAKFAARNDALDELLADLKPALDGLIRMSRRLEEEEE